MSTDYRAPVQARIRRSRSWAAVHLVVHVAALLTAMVMAAASVLTGVVEWLLLVAIVVATTVLHAACWRTARRRPAGWPLRASAVAALDAAALWGAAPLRLDVVLPVAAAAVVVEVGAAVLAGRALSAPLSPDLGAAPVDVTAKLRTGFPPVLGRLGIRPGWLGIDEAILTGKAVVVTVRNNLSWKARLTIPLESVLAVGSRPAEPTDSPWIRLDDWASDVPPGDVLVVRQAVGLRVVPVLHAAEFSEIVRVRAGLVQGHPVPRLYAEPSEGPARSGTPGRRFGRATR